MEISEYKNIYLNESTHFFYVSTQTTVIRFIKKYLSFKGKLKILDAGCGTGILLKKMAKFGQVYGVDNHAEAIKFCQKRGLKNVHQTDIAKLPFPSESIDLITCIDVLYHKDIKSDVKVLKEFYRVLKPKGFLILKNPAYNWLRGKHDTIVHTAHRYQRLELENKLKNSGFIVKKITYAYTFIFPFVLVKRLLEHFSQNPSSDIDKISKPLNKLLIYLHKMETWIILRFNLPFGLSIYAVGQKPLKFK